MSKTTNKLSLKVRDHAVRLVLDKITVPDGDVDFREDWLRACKRSQRYRKDIGFRHFACLHYRLVPDDAFGVETATATVPFRRWLTIWKRRQVWLQGERRSHADTRPDARLSARSWLPHPRRCRASTRTVFLSLKLAPTY